MWGWPLGKARKHGETNYSTNSGKWTPEYTAWINMKTRCFNKKHSRYKFYGGRGITICKRWLLSFANFLLDMGRKPGPRYSLDRINNNGNYTQKNCRWATYEQQNNNRSI